MKMFKVRQIYLLFISIMGVFLIAGCSGGGGGGGTGGGGGGGDVTAPTVTFKVPAAGAGVVPLNRKIAVTFSEAMDPATITTTTFTLDQAGAPVAGTVAYSGLVAIFTPGGNLTASLVYTATITTGAKDLAGNALAVNKVWTFTTGVAADATAPTVDLTDPAAGATFVALNKKISATFSESMDQTTITTTTFTLDQAGAPVAGTVAYADKIATFTPTSNLAAGATYTVTITTGVKDLTFPGNALAVNKVWTFDTGAAADTTAPTVTSTSPADTDIGVAVNKKPSALFNEAMDPATITTATFTLKQGATAVTGTVGYVGNTATFTPDSDLTPGLKYDATITTGAKDTAGNALAVNKLWSFTTIAALPLGPAPVDLGTAGNFVILTKTGITTTGVTNITGDIGTSPITGAAIAGFTCGVEVTGTIYTVDAAGPACRVTDPVMLTTAISDMATAYTDAAGRATPDGTELYAGNLTGQTFAPGLYKWGTGVSVNAAGTVTLTGAATDVWIFQIAGDLIMNPGSSVTLVGAQPENVFWQVGGTTGAALNTTVAFQGIILAEKAITINTGASLTGRSLSQTNCTLNANAITAP